MIDSGSRRRTAVQSAIGFYVKNPQIHPIIFTTLFCFVLFMDFVCECVCVCDFCVFLIERVNDDEFTFYVTRDDDVSVNMKIKSERKEKASFHKQTKDAFSSGLH